MPNKVVLEQPSEPLVNYLRTHRRRAALTQHELGRVLGYGSHGAVSRHERFESMPSLLMALSYEVLYKVPVSEIFIGLTETVQSAVEEQLAEFENYLGEQNAQGPRATAIARKLEWLSERRSSGYK